MLSVPLHLKLTTILLLALSVGRIPVPWVHSHGWLGDEALAEHLESSHHCSFECDIPGGVHVHIFTWREALPLPDGLNNVPPRSSSDLYDRTQSVSLPTNESEWLERLQASPPQLALSSLKCQGETDSPFNSAEPAYRWSACESLGTARANLGVYLL